MTPEQLQEIVSVGQEHRSIEFKGHGSRTDKSFLCQVVRAVLAMANNQDGGTVLIGVNEKTRAIEGLSSEELASWELFDDVHKDLNKYADPFVDFTITVVPLEPKPVVVIRVSEFLDIPVICKQDGAESNDKRKILQRGACYVRGRTRGIESISIPSHVEMRELLDRAANKKLRQFIERASSAGLTVAASPDRYGEEEQSFKSDCGLVGIKPAQPCWQVVMFPLDYVESRIPFSKLEEVVREAVVNYRYVSFPEPSGSRATVRRGVRYVGSVSDHAPTDLWRIHESGMFIAIQRGVIRPASSDNPRPPGILMLDIVRMYLQAYEFAARLYQGVAGYDPIWIDVQAQSLGDRELVEPDGWFCFQRKTVDFSTWSRPAKIERTQLLGDTRNLAKSQAYELLQRFDPKIGQETLDKLVAIVMGV